MHNIATVCMPDVRESVRAVLNTKITGQRHEWKQRQDQQEKLVAALKRSWDMMQDQVTPSLQSRCQSTAYERRGRAVAALTIPPGCR